MFRTLNPNCEAGLLGLGLGLEAKFSGLGLGLEASGLGLGLEASGLGLGLGLEALNSTKQNVGFG